MKKELRKYAGNIGDEKQSAKSGKDKKEPDENKTQEDANATKAEKEAKKSISRWDTDGGKDLCP